MSTHSTHSLKFQTITLVIGVLSGLLTAEVARFVDPGVPFLGVIFGAAIIILVWIQHKYCSERIVVGLLGFAVVSYSAAVWVTLPLTGILGRAFGPESDFSDPLGAPMFTLAGFLGALIINAALLERLYRASGWRLLGKAAAWACVGGFLGFIAAEFTGPVGTAVTAVVGDPPASDMGSDRRYLAFYSAYLIWQTGMAFQIVWMITKSPASRTDQPAPDA